MHIQVRINEEGALRNQRYAFTDRFTLVTELLQNARRAGATRIHITHDVLTQRLRVTDDGHGIADFQKLLTFNESGWDEATTDQERPFGIGFSKCLYAASRCIVASGDQCVDFETEAALAKAPIEVADMEAPVTGTVIELEGVDLPELANRIESLCQGFSVTVVFNDKTMERRYAEANLARIRTAIGSIHITGTSDGKHNSHTLVFLQGLCVMQPIYFQEGQVNVVHLDSRQFTARLPDREKLIDEDVQRRRIDAELKACWRRTLEGAKTQLDATHFVETYYSAMRSWGHLDLLNDLDVLPRGLCDSIVGYPIQDDSGTRDHVQTMAVTPTRADVESGAVTLVALDSVNDENAARWMLARAKAHVVFDWVGLHADHWAQRHVRMLEDEPADVEAVSEQHRTELEGRWIWPTVVLCEAVRVRVGDDSADVRDAGVHHAGCLYIPVEEASGEPVRQASSFTDEHDQFLESERDADRDALANLIQRLRSVDPLQTLDSLLQGLKLGKYPLLRGKQFHLTVGVGAAPGHSLELADDVAQGGSDAQP
ncbi:MAG: ATP-binding protein [Rhizobacter sp.]